MHSPSGENTQPWRFEINPNNQLFVLTDNEKDTSIYNNKNRTVHLACGAIIETIVIVAKAEGYEADVKLFPLETMMERVACITFSVRTKKLDEEDVDLYNATKLRQSNRYAYLPTETKAFEEFCSYKKNAYKFCSIQTTTNKKLIELLAKSASVTEYLAMHNKLFHSFFSESLFWSKNKRTTGFYVPTLGLSLLERIHLPIVANWTFVSVFNLFNFAEWIRKNAIQKFITSSCMGTVSVTEDTPRAFVNAGRTLTKIWLFATSQNYSFQTLGMPLLQYTLLTSHTLFSLEEYKETDIAIKIITSTFPSKQETPALMFRVGKTAKRAPNTPKAEPKITYI